MKVLFATGEVWPFIKTGGLGDVAHSLPKVLKKKDVDIRVILPKYSQIDEKFKNKMEYIGYTYIELGSKRKFCGVEKLSYEGVEYYFIDNEDYFKRSGVYGEWDDCERFSFFNKAILEVLEIIDFIPDVIHCNDWHTGLIPVYLDHLKKWGQYREMRTLFTIHNLRYQGIFPQEVLGDIVPLEYGRYFHEEGLKYHDMISFMKGGVNYCDHISTVSETYAEEIKTKFYGENLEGLFNCHGGKLSGIVNGIDYELFNPEKDKELSKNFGISTIEDKGKNKIALQKECGLLVSPKTPLIGIITRLVDQKGLDLIECVLTDLIHRNLQIVLLGTGDKKYEDLLRHYGYLVPEKLSVNIMFDQELAKKIYAGSDMFLMPSLFEPCGLSQMISMRYGTVPIVRETGGLKDTIEPYNEYENKGNGFSFKNYNAHEMLDTIDYAIRTYHDKAKWKELAIRGMKSNNSWDQTALKYKKIYKSILEN